MLDIVKKDQWSSTNTAEEISSNASSSPASTIRQTKMKGIVDDISLLLLQGDYGHYDFASSSTQADLDGLVDKIQGIFAQKGTTLKGLSMDLVEDCFASCDKQFQEKEKAKQFEITEKFILQEQNSGRRRRAEARRAEAEEEKRLASDIAHLKGFREHHKLVNTHDELQRKILDGERAYFNRKMVVSKASQVASGECRRQFTRVRDFFLELHHEKKEALVREHRRSLRRLEVIQRLKNTDDRVIALERQIAERVYKKKLQDLNELHMAQNLEEAIYLESMLELLDNVQVGKETAIRELFELNVQHLKERRQAYAKRVDDLAKFRADATVQIAKLVASYYHDDKESEEGFGERGEQVETMERRKNFDPTGKKKSATVSELYDTVLWSVVTNHVGLTSSGSSDYSSEFDDDEDDDDADDPAKGEGNDEDYGDQGEPGARPRSFWDTSDGGSTSESVGSNEGSRRTSDLSPVGNMHVKQLTRDLRSNEKDLIKQHAADAKKERHEYRKKVRAHKAKHRAIIDGLVEQALIERQNLREGIEQHMAALEEQQKHSTEQVREQIEEDKRVMQEALQAEEKRVEEAGTASFAKAQTIISAQVFHEVRNALSSVIAMSEIACSLKQDSAVSATQLVSSVEDMLDQIKEIVDYALKMLNNVLDISKITSGNFQVKSEAFNLEDLVARATRMQQAKSTGKIRMSFASTSQPCIAFSDSDIVIRIVTNLISNALKFTTSGGVQPFICPLEEISSSAATETEITKQINQANDSTAESELPLDNLKKKYVALGVADTGCGLSRRKLKFAETTLSDCDPRSINAHGVRDSGFGLYLTHLLAKALGSKLELSSLDKCHNVLNEDLAEAMQQREARMAVLQGKNVPNSVQLTSSIPGRGTVLYIVLPVYEDSEGAKTALAHRRLESDNYFFSDASEAVGELLSPDRQYLFRPRPSPKSLSGSFRIMIADDVLMLRKGLVHLISSVFQDCPVSISTACTAEDLLRAVENNPYDLIICDNLFHHDASVLKRVAPEKEGVHARPNVFFDGQVTSKKQVRDEIAAYFKNERFTLQEGDGEMTGFQALIRLANATNPCFPIPVLMLLSGHKIEAPMDVGIIVAQKPLKQSEFAPLFERSANHLLYTGRCIEDVSVPDSCSDTASSTCSESGDVPASDSGSSEATTVVNFHGTQLFISHG